VKWPKRVKHHKKVLATIYGKSRAYPFYRVAYSVDGKRRMKSFATYAGEEGAKAWAEQKARELHKGSRVAALTPQQANDALAAFDRLHSLYQSTGKKVSLLVAVSEFAESAAKLNGFTHAEAIAGFLSNVAAVKRQDVRQAVEDFISERKKRTVAEDGKRPKLSPEHFYNTSLWLREFGNSFPGYAVCDLKAQELGSYMAGHSDVSGKTRNERRAVIKMLLQWCAEQEQSYVAPTSRLFEAKALKHEDIDDNGEVECYTAKELQSMLDRATMLPRDEERDYRELLPVIALGGLAGMRLKEILRLTWEDVFRVQDHIEVKAHKSKTRSRRLIQTCPALAQWLESYRERTGPVWAKGYDMLGEDFADLCAELKITKRRNALRHSFVSAHFAVHADEGLTSMQAGNSPAVVHKNYKGLMTKKEGEAWFNVRPENPSNVLHLATA
jgi:hypothetical protein